MKSSSARAKLKKGAQAAVDMKEKLPNGNISGTDNLTASQQAEVVVLSVPYWAQQSTLETVKSALEGKVLVTVVAPTGEKAARAFRLESGLSAAEEAQQQLGENTKSSGRIPKYWRTSSARP